MSTIKFTPDDGPGTVSRYVFQSVCNELADERVNAERMLEALRAIVGEVNDGKHKGYDGDYDGVLAWANGLDDSMSIIESLAKKGMGDQ